MVASRSQYVKLLPRCTVVFRPGVRGIADGCPRDGFGSSSMLAGVLRPEVRKNCNLQGARDATHVIDMQVQILAKRLYSLTFVHAATIPHTYTPHEIAVFSVYHVTNEACG